jgi:hypothetical protein
MPEGISQRRAAEKAFPHESRMTGRNGDEPTCGEWRSTRRTISFDAQKIISLQTQSIAPKKPIIREFHAADKCREASHDNRD